MNRKRLRQLLTGGFLCAVTFCAVPSFAEPTPLLPVTRPTEKDLKGISFSVSVWDSALKVGDPIHLKIVLKNTSNHPLFFLDRHNGGDEINYLISLERVGGKSPRLTEHGLTLYSPPDVERFEAIHRQLNPGESVEITLDVSHIYRIKEAGEYRVQVKRYVAQGKKDLLIPILSNKLTLKIQAD